MTLNDFLLARLADEDALYPPRVRYTQALREAIECIWETEYRLANEFTWVENVEDLYVLEEQPPALRCLADPYSHHPDFNQAWAIPDIWRTA